MAFSTLTITTVTNATAVVTLTSTDQVSAKQFCQNLPQQGGVFDDTGVFYPLSAVLKITIS